MAGNSLEPQIPRNQNLELSEVIQPLLLEGINLDLVNHQFAPVYDMKSCLHCLNFVLSICCFDTDYGMKVSYLETASTIQLLTLSDNYVIAFHICFIWVMLLRQRCKLIILLPCRNIIHGSDGPETAKDEIKLWFKPEELVSYSSNAEKWIYGVN